MFYVLFITTSAEQEKVGHHQRFADVRFNLALTLKPDL